MENNLNKYDSYEIKRNLEASKKLAESDNELLKEFVRNKKKEEQDEAFVDWDEYL